jgi:6-pyruvoyltetrahydropterin/6-carboxytetrahydropterin synthase
VARNPLNGRKNMYRLRVKSEFDAAHKMEGYPGKCSQLHGHSYTVEAFLLAKKMDEIGVSVDLRKLKQKLQDIVEQFDHSYLNDFKELDAPSTENLSRLIFMKMKINLPEGVTLEKVRVWETPKSWIEYFEG